MLQRIPRTSAATATTEFDAHFIINLKPKEEQIDTIKSLLIEVGIGIPTILYDGTFVFYGKNISHFESQWEKQLTNFSIEYDK